jgi:hypothetical protein
MITSKQVSIPITETLLHTAIGKSKLTIKSISSVDIYIGPTGLSTSDGYNIGSSNNSSLNYEFELSDGDSLYGLSAASTGSVQILITT